MTQGVAGSAGQVVELHEPLLTTGSPPVVAATAVAQGFRRLLLGLTGSADMKQAWQAALPQLQPGQTVGLKVNVLNRKVPTHPEVVQAVVGSLKSDLGLAGEQILVWDRRLDELSAAGLTEQALQCQVMGTLERVGSTGQGPGYEEQAICIAGQNTRLSQVQTRHVDHLINLSVMKNHRASGFTGCLKNHYGTIDNPGSFHDRTDEAGNAHNYFEQAIPAINALPEVAGKARLWLVDATIGVCKGDTDSSPDCLPNRLLASFDPVALDARGRALRDELAQGSVQESISDGWLSAAERVGLGVRQVKVTSV